MTLIKDFARPLPDRGGMTSATQPPAAATATAARALLAALPGSDGDVAAAVTASTAWLLADAAAAVGFAAGLAGAVAAIAGDVASLLPWLALAFVCLCARGLAAWFAARAGAAAARAAKGRLRSRLVRAALFRRHGAASAPPAGSMTSRVVDEVDAMDAYLARFVPARRAAAAAPVLILASTAFASPVAAAILATTLVPFAALMVLAGTASAAESHRQFTALARLSGLFADRVRALPIVLAFRAEPRETGRLASAADEVAKRTLRVLRLAFVSSAVLEFFAALCVALVAVYAGFNLLGLLPFPAPERLDLGRAFFVLALAPEFYAPMRRLAAAYHDRQAAQTVAERVLGFECPTDAGNRSVAAVTALAGAGPPHVPGPAPRLRFDHVTIHHAGEPAPCVRQLSFSLRGGQTLALVGPSGSGKTSVLRLLLAMAPLSGGGVWIDGERLDRSAGIAARSAWVGQSPLIVPGSLRDNLLLAAPFASTKAMEAAASRAGLDALLAGRDGGLDTVIDERGSGLSGGERQRIAVARSLLKPASVWLLDEPTAHLDAVAEHSLIDCIADARLGRTTVIATHSERLAALADVVVHLETAR